MDLQLATVSAVSRSSVRCYLFFADHCKEYKLGDWIIFWLWFFLIGAAAVANNWRHRIGTGKKFLRAETFGIEIGIGERLSGTKPSFCVNLVLGKRGKPKKGFFQVLIVLIWFSDFRQHQLGWMSFWFVLSLWQIKLSSFKRLSGCQIKSYENAFLPLAGFDWSALAQTANNSYLCLRIHWESLKTTNSP